MTVRVVGFLARISFEKDGPERTEKFSKLLKISSVRKPFEAQMKGSFLADPERFLMVSFAVFDGAEKTMASEFSSALPSGMFGNLYGSKKEIS